MYYDSALFAIPIAIYIIFFIATIAFYVLGAYGLYKISKNTGMNNAWFSFIPIANLYLIGKLADRYNKNRGKKSSLGMLLPILSIAPSAIYLLIICFGLVSTISYQFSLPSLFLVGLMPLVFIIILVSIASSIMKIYALYLVYQDFEPSRAVPYTILAVLGLEVIPFILIRNNIPVGMAGEQYPRQPKFNKQ